MKLVHNLTGLKIGKWLVKERIVKNTRTYYSCICDCGNQREVDRYKLIKKTSTQCRDCYAKEKLLDSGKCKKGHDINVVGLIRANKNRTCALCAWERYIWYKYGISLEEYRALYFLQKGKCAICKKPIILHSSLGLKTEGKRTEIDHKHVPKKIKPQPKQRTLVRGLLCGGRYAGCNAKLGHVDNAEWLRSAAEYLENPPALQIIK